MPHLINKMPQCHNSLLTALSVATKCHKNATMPQLSNRLIFSIATDATSATAKRGYAYTKEKHGHQNTKSPEEEHFLPQGCDMI